MNPEPNPTSAVNPSQASVDGLAARPDEDAIIMVNLLRYQPDGGRESYYRYGAVASGTVRARGGSVAYTAPVIGPDPAWDTVTLVRYPRRAAYLDMQSDPAYVGAIPDRTAGLSARLLYPFHPVGGDHDHPFRIERSGGDEVFVVSLVRFADGNPAAAWSPAGDVVLRLQADVPMVSDAVWHELIVARYRSQADLPPDPGDHGDGIEDAITLITQPTP